MSSRASSGVEALVVVGGDADDRTAFGHEAGEVGGLVLVSLAEDQIAVRRVQVVRLQVAARNGQREVRQVRAREVPREVGRGEAERAVGLQAHD